MATIAQTMLRDALDAFVRHDLDLAQHVLNEDDRLDSLKTQIFRELLTSCSRPQHHRARAGPDPRLPPPRAIGDNATNRRRGRDSSSSRRATCAITPETPATLQGLTPRRADGKVR